MANWSNPVNLSFSDGLPLPVLSCVPEFKVCQDPTQYYDVLKSSVVFKALCVSTDFACKTLIIAYDEASLCQCISASVYNKERTVNDTLKLTNMTLLDECPLTHDNTDEKKSQVSTHILYGTNILKINNTVLPSLNICTLIIDDTGECKDKLDSWPFTMEIFTCSFIIIFIAFVLFTIWKRIRKENDRISDQENIELESEVTLMENNEITY
ncbi:hypothetical protein OTU49_004170 [Cherax quadricarinatus]|uniref:Uncharacterized protein n=2 Tax=Cherax quadricarinatus TaxID=27406 RepID=A0AAW0X153_CHEQU